MCDCRWQHMFFFCTRYLELFQVRELRVRIAIVIRTDVLLSVTACKQHRAFDLAPVSYTHLDVYKRQVWNTMRL